jgi:hypothetical protein
MPGPDQARTRPPDERPMLGEEDDVQCPQPIDVVQLISTAKEPVMGSLEHSDKLDILDRFDDRCVDVLYEGKTASSPISDPPGMLAP